MIFRTSDDNNFSKYWQDVITLWKRGESRSPRAANGSGQRRQGRQRSASVDYRECRDRPRGRERGELAYKQAKQFAHVAELLRRCDDDEMQEILMGKGQGGIERTELIGITSFTIPKEYQHLCNLCYVCDSSCSKFPATKKDFICICSST